MTLQQELDKHFQELLEAYRRHQLWLLAVVLTADGDKPEKHKPKESKK